MTGNPREQIFLEELDEMAKLNYITRDEQENMRSKYSKFALDRQNYIKIRREQAKIKSKEIKPKRVLSPREVRDRSITWILMLGVIMILLSGLLLATSNWKILNSAVKTLSIALVAILFFGTSIVADKVLKIEKTSFAFWVLGSLFLPVAVLSAGYFELFGHYFSIFGRGKYLLGAAGATLCMPVYIYSTLKYRNRLFSWFTLLALSAETGFILSAFYPRVDVFYLCITVYNGLLLAAYEKLKNKEKLKLFTVELPIFAQVNIIITTLFLLAFYNDPRIYGFNIILTSILYISMVFAGGRREYSFVFSALLVYGIYVIVEHSGTGNLDFVLFSLVGFIFIALERFLKDDETLKKIFRYVSAFVSFCAFVFVSAKGISIRQGHPSLLMLLSYLLISINYIYLSGRTGKKLFSFLAPIFLIPAGNQAFKLMQQHAVNYDYSIHMFAVGVLIFFGLYYMNKWEYTKKVKSSSGIVSAAIMIYSMFRALFTEKWTIAAALFYCFSVILFIVFRYCSSKVLKAASKWAMPMPLFIGSAALFGLINTRYHSKLYTLSLHLIICLFVILSLSIVLKKYIDGLELPLFWIPFILMPFSVTLLLVEAALRSDFRAVPFALGVLMIYEVYSMFRYRAGLKNIIFMYSLFLTFSLTLSSSFEALGLDSEWQYYVMFITSIGIVIYWILSKEQMKKYISMFFVPFSMLGVYALNSLSGYGNYHIYSFTAAVIYIGLILYANHVSGWRLLDALPLFLLLASFDSLINDVLKTDYRAVMALTVLSAVFIISGRLLSKVLFTYKQGLFIDWYSIFGFISILIVQGVVPENSVLALKLLSPVLFSCFLFFQVKRVKGKWAEKTVFTIAWVSIIYPYYTLLHYARLQNIIITEMYVLPWVALAAALSRSIWKDFRRVSGSVELAVVLLVSAVLFKDILSDFRIEDGIIMGILSLCSIIAGMQLKIKSYFFVGTGTLLLNLFIQTREFWKSIPWWVYLLVAGLILIVTASMNEMQKNSGGKKTKKMWKDFIEKFLK